MSSPAWPRARASVWIALVLALSAHGAVLYALLYAPRPEIIHSDLSLKAPIDIHIVTGQAAQPAPTPPPPKPAQDQATKPATQTPQRRRTPPPPIEQPKAQPTAAPNTPAISQPEPAVEVSAPEPAQTTSALEAPVSSREPASTANTQEAAPTTTEASVSVICPGYQQAIRASPPPRQVMRARVGGEVLVEFTVQPDGAIYKPWVVSTSNRQLNRWALRTVEHSVRCIGQRDPIQLRLPIKLTFDTP